MTGMGWISYVAARNAGSVAEIARDIGLFTKSDVQEYFADAQRTRYGRSVEEEIEYVYSYLADAQAFVGALANQVRGLVYPIG